jgi:nucleoside-diphosphate-sugar epimerase
MKALVTGAAGFVGSAISRRLLVDGHDVVGIDALSDYYDVSLKRRNLETLVSDKFTFVNSDINATDIDSLLKGVSWVFHEAGQPGVRKSWGEDFGIYIDANVAATQRLLEGAARSSSIERFVYASSSSIYGDAETFPTPETARPHPLSPYGVTKLAAEHLCTLYAANFGVPTVSLRYFTVYGPGQRPDMAFTRFVRAAVTNGEITIYGTGEQIRDFTFIDDVVEANILAATNPSPHGSVFNVAGGTNVSVKEVLALLEEIHGEPLNVNFIASVAGDVFRTGGDTSKISALLGWTPKVSLREGLQKQLQWANASFSAELATG